MRCEDETFFKSPITFFSFLCTNLNSMDLFNRWVYFIFILLKEKIPISIFMSNYFKWKKLLTIFSNITKCNCLLVIDTDICLLVLIDSDIFVILVNILTYFDIFINILIFVGKFVWITQKLVPKYQMAQIYKKMPNEPFLTSSPNEIIEMNSRTRKCPSRSRSLFISSLIIALISLSCSIFCSHFCSRFLSLLTKSLFSLSFT